MVIDVNREAERRVLLVAPTTRDGEVTRSLLAQAGLACVVCDGLRELARAVEAGAAVVLLTEEAVAAPGIDELLMTFAKQPPWSDLAVVLLIKGGTLSPAATRVLRSLRNVTLLERPAPARSVLSAVQTAVRGRDRQYQIRDQIESLRRTEAMSSQLRRQLEIAVDASELGTFHCEMPLGGIVWNEQCKRHFWLPPEAEVDFDLFYSILHPDDRERTHKPWRPAYTAATRMTSNIVPCHPREKCGGFGPPAAPRTTSINSRFNSTALPAMLPIVSGWKRPR